MRKRDFTVSLSDDLRIFWTQKTMAQGISCSAWLARTLSDWKNTGVEPASHVQTKVTSAVAEARVQYEAARSAYDRAGKGPRLPDAEFARIRQAFQDARARYDMAEKAAGLRDFDE